jgi:hypothetical protein
MTVFSTPERVVMSRTRGVTSWSMSRSTVTIVVSRLSFASSCSVIVPITSSAS